MNKVQIYGRVSYKSELRQTGSGKNVINISIATGYGDKVTFVPITVWDRQAEIVNNYVDKGNRLLVEGRITENKIVKNDVDFIDHKVTADFVHLVESKKDKETTPQDFVQPEPTYKDDMPF